MNWRECEYIIKILRLKIYDAVSESTITYFVANHPDIAGH